MPDLRFGAEDSLGGNALFDHTALESEPLLGGGLVEEEIARCLVAQVASVGKVVLVEVAALGGAMPVAVALFDDALGDSFLGGSDHVVKRKLAGGDAVGQAV